jgi:hypothetical protein
MSPEDTKDTEPVLDEAFDRLVAEGTERLSRSWLPLIGTGLLGGIDVGTGVLAYLLVDHATHSTLLAGIAFSIGFVALLLARSDLFTENFLLPVVAVAAPHSSLLMLNLPFVVGLDQHAGREAQHQGGGVAEDAHDVGSALDLLAQPLQRVGAPRLASVCLGEVGEGGDLLRGVVHHLSCRWQLDPSLSATVPTWARTSGAVGWAKMVRIAAETIRPGPRGSWRGRFS